MSGLEVMCLNLLVELKLLLNEECSEVMFDIKVIICIEVKSDI